MSNQPERHEKKHDPTPKRLKKARDDGNVFRSQEVQSVGLLAAAFALIFGGMGALFYAFEIIIERAYGNAVNTTLSIQTIPHLSIDLGGPLALVMLPFFGILIVVGVALSVAQTGWNLTMKPLQPKINRISPLKGFKQLFSSKGLFTGFKSLVKICLVGPIVYFTISEHFGSILMLHTLPLVNILGTANSWILSLVSRILIALALLAALDYTFEKWKHKQDLKMTDQEVKDEMKENEGDPMVRGKRRELARVYRRRPRMDHAVLQSDVVITNPTHYAIALKYDPEESAAPRVMLKGIRKRAQRIKALADELGVPMVEDRPLARSLYDTVEEEHEIPEELYPAVAAILAEIYRARNSYLN